MFVVIPYVLIGGYTTLAWIDLFQGSFLLCVICFVPLYVMKVLGGWTALHGTLLSAALPLTLIPDSRPSALANVFFIATGWGLGYFGQPHIVTKFMGIRNVEEIPKSKWVGMIWMVIALSAATFVGLVGIAFFSGKGLMNAQEVFILMVRQTFHPFLAGLFLCGILATTINSMSSQVLIVSSNLAEDFYKRFLRKKASQKELLLVSRLGILLVAVNAFLIVSGGFSSIYGLVLYAWSGLGASFGPLVLFSLFSRKINRYGAWAGILSGGVLSATWPLIQSIWPTGDVSIPPLVPGFVISCLMIWIVSTLTSSFANGGKR
jgi:sodium/proline symporter